MRRVLLILVGTLLFVATPVGAEEKEEPKWPGVDETVVEKHAEELGRSARDPFINTDQGDLLLFLFALAGALGGFVMGYYWHKVFIAGRQNGSDRD